jgi:GNAT superfamily N-acetyltransferase
MRFVRFSKKHLPEFNAMLDSAKGEFGAAWALHMRKVFSKGACKKCHLGLYSVLDGNKLCAAFSTRREVEAFVLYFILIGKGSQGKGIGTQIVSRVEAMARKEKAKFLRLDIYSGKKVASFYKKLGFKPGGRVRYYEEDGDDQAFLYKKL